MKKKSILIIGLGAFGQCIAEKFALSGHDIMAVDKDEERVNEVIGNVTDGQIGDSTNRKFLETLGIGEYDACIVAIGGDFQSSLETACLLKELGAKKVISRAESDTQAKFLLKNGADEIVYPEKQLAGWLAIKYGSDHILDYMELDSDCSICEVEIPKSWRGKSIAKTDIRKKYGINIIAIKSGGKIDAAVTPDLVLDGDMTLFVLGKTKDMKKLFGI